MPIHFINAFTFCSQGRIKTVATILYICFHYHRHLEFFVPEYLWGKKKKTELRIHLTISLCGEESPV